MTVPASQPNRYSYAGNGVTTDFAYNSKFLANADLVVVLVNDTTGVETTQTITTHYTVTGAGTSAGTVTFVTAPASGYTVVIYGDPVLSQLVDPINGDDLDVDAVIEAPLDKLTILVRRVKDIVTRALRQPEGDTADIARLPAAADRASKYLAFDADGDPIASTGDAGSVPVSAFMETVLDDTTAAAARATLLIETGSTVASATTPDIWTGTGHLINYTGTATATGFAAAPQAGAARTLVCAGAAVFTAGANMIIPGIAPAANFTAAANTRIEVVALSTTQFLLNVLKADGTSVVGATAASQAEQEAGTEAAKYVAPATQQFHPKHPKAWGLVTVSGGTYTLAASSGVASINKNATGQIDVTLSTAMSSTSYSVVVNSLGPACRLVTNTITSTTVFRVYNWTVGAIADDNNGFTFCVFGDQ